MKSNTLSFVAIGDWGFDLNENNEDGPRADWDMHLLDQLAQTMRAQMKKITASFVLNVGDNFYQYGIKSKDDPRWKTTFEQMFPFAYSTPWYSALGNHDYKGNLLEPITRYDQGIYAEIQRTMHKDNTRWCMPNNNYTLSVDVNSFGVELVVFDTQAILRIDPYDDGSNTAYRGVLVPDKDAHIEWLRDKLCSLRDAYRQRNKKLWLIVSGHHFVTSVGNYFVQLDNTDLQLMTQKIEPILHECEVDLYFHGHDHVTQAMILTNELHSVYQIGVGSSGKTNGQILGDQEKLDALYGEERRKLLLATTDAAFGSFQITESKVSYSIIRADGEVLLKSEVTK